MDNYLYCYYFDSPGECISVGKGIDNTICIPWDCTLSDEHFVFEKSGDDVFVRSLGQNGCYVNCIPDSSAYKLCNDFPSASSEGCTKVLFGERILLQFGDTVIAGSTFFLYLHRFLVISDYAAEDKEHNTNRKRIVRLKRIQTDELYPEEDFVLNKDEGLVVPSSRAIASIDISEIEMDYPPARQIIKNRTLFMTIGPAFTMAIPMVAASLTAMYFSRTRYGNSSAFMYTGIITASLAAMIGIFWGCMNLRNEKKIRKRQERKRRRAYNEYVRSCERKIGDRYRDIRRNLIWQFPSVKDFLIDLSKERIWNHTSREQDYLYIRLGLGEIKSNVPIRIPKTHFQIEEDRLKALPDILSRKYSVLKEVPVCISLLDNKVIGLVCSGAKAGLQMVYIIAGQLIFHYSPSEIKLVFILIDRDIDNFSFCRFVPHFSNGRTINICERDEDVSEFITILEKEIIDSDSSGIGYFIIFTDAYGSVPERIRNSPKVIIFILCFEYKQLPGECSSIIQNAYGFSGIYELSNASDRKPLCFDGISAYQFEKICRFVSGFSIRPNQSILPIPKIVSVEDVYLCLGKVFCFEEVVRSWRDNNSLDNIRIPVGMGENGRLCYLDFHEAFHGPHGLIAGMTGSGKSELLGAIILMLSLKYSPNFVNFFLIDYKGGGMSNLFSKLPHLCGNISNLSDNLIYRAMVSVRSENKRRQRLFLKYHINCIRDYEKLFLAGRVNESLPHIFIIIDEFAELKRNEPEFMRELISVAQVGRSLGIHLILATQRPQGTVDDNILGNSRFRICLRVQDRQDSMDVLRRAEAASLSNPGRAFFQVGNDEHFEEFQSIYTMSSFSVGEHSNSIFLVDSFGREKELSERECCEAATSHTAAIKFIKEAAMLSGMSETKPLFSSLLPKQISLLELDSKKDDTKRDAAKGEPSGYPIGKYDDIEGQRHKTLYLSFIRDGHIIICGMPGSGKSTLLKSLLFEIMKESPAFSKVIYIVDTKSSFPETILKSPFICGYFSNSNFNSIGALFHRVNSAIKERRESYKGKTFSEVTDNHDPAIVIIIDNYGFFRDETKEKYDRDIFYILKNGEALGVFLVISGNMIGNEEIPAKVHELVRTVICLAMIDKLSYLQIMRLSRIDICPEKGIKGRGIVFADGSLYEFQTARITGDEAVCFQNISVEKQADYSFDDYRKQKELYYIPVICDNLTFDIFSHLTLPENFTLKKTGGLPVGYIAESYESYELPILESNHFFITGRMNSGKKNLAKVIGCVSERAGFVVEIIDSIEKLNDFIGKFRNDIESAAAGKDEISPKGLRLIVVNNPGIILCNFNKTALKEQEKEIEDFLYANSIKKKGEMHALKILVVLSREDERKLTGRRLFDALKNNAYSIHMGGYVDEQHIADYSYLSFSEKSAALEAGQGYVMPSLNGSFGSMFRGKIIVPLWTK